MKRLGVFSRSTYDSRMIGWWMVKSGIEANRRTKVRSASCVSPVIVLAAHLAGAFATIHWDGSGRH